jgi:hypothetical protein
LGDRALGQETRGLTLWPENQAVSPVGSDDRLRIS